MAKNVIIRIFKETSMSYQHDGLKRLAADKKVNLSNLGAGEFVVFVNSKKDKIKLFGANGLLSYYRSPSGALDLRMIEQLPLCFNGKAMDWDLAQKKMLEKLLATQEKKRPVGLLAEEDA